MKNNECACCRLYGVETEAVTSREIPRGAGIYNMWDGGVAHLCHDCAEMHDKHSREMIENSRGPQISNASGRQS